MMAAFCSAMYSLPFLHLLSHNGDEGTMLVHAVRVSEGQLPFRDFFDLLGPGTFYALALFFRLFGVTWLTTRIYVLLVTTGIVVLLLFLARRLRGGFEVSALVFFVAVSYDNWNVVSHHMDSNLFGLIAFAAFVWWTDKPCPIKLVVAGMAAGLTQWFMMPKGLSLFASLVLVVWTLYRKDRTFYKVLGFLLSGFLIVHLVVLTYFWAQGGLKDLLYAIYAWPIKNYSDINAVPYAMGLREFYWPAFSTSFKPLLSHGIGLALSGALLIPFFVLAILPLILTAVLAAFRRPAFFDRTSIPYWIVGATFWLSEIHRKDLAHLVFGSPLLILLMYFCCFQIKTGWMNATLRIVTACAVFLAALNPLTAMASPYRHNTRRGIVYDANRDTPVLEFLNTHTAPNDLVFVYPYSPIYYFLTATRNPTRVDVLLYGYNTSQDFQGVIRDLGAKQVKYVVWDRSFPMWIRRWFPAYRFPSDDALILEPYLVENYRIIGGSPVGFQFLERISENPGTTPPPRDEN
jgi:hypothetical protein